MVAAEAAQRDREADRQSGSGTVRLAVIGENVEIAGAGNHRMIFGAKGGT
jgi:hypothetical protein